MAVFRAGQSITINPGFQAAYGSLFTTQFGGCYDGLGPIVVPSPYPTIFDPCISGPNSAFPIISTNATSYYLVWDDLYGQVSTYSGEIDGSIPGALTLVPVSLPDNAYLYTNYVYHLWLYGCNGNSLYLTGNMTVDNPCGTDMSKTNSPIKPMDTIPAIFNTFEVYPNPTCDDIKINISNYTPSDQIQILNVSGQQVRQYNPTGNIQSYDLSELSDGVYTIKYISTNNTQTRKIVKVCN